MRDFHRIRQELLDTGRWGDPSPEVAERASYRCEYCDLDLLASLRTYKQWEIHHIVPKSSGGSQVDLENLALACTHCNRHLKGKWNPKPAKESLTRRQLIDRVKRYIDDIDPHRHRYLHQDRAIIGYVPAEEQNA